MTREEAIQRFNGIINAMSISVAQSKFYPSKAELNELCEMAIEALTDRHHGRLIDADKLCEVLNEKKIPVDSRVNYEIVNAPTVSADRPQCEWEHTEEVTTMDGLHWHVWRCTNCNCSGNPDMNYCPNCGAKMDGNTDNPNGFTADEWYRNTFKDGDAE